MPKHFYEAQITTAAFMRITSVINYHIIIEESSFFALFFLLLLRKNALVFDPYDRDQNRILSQQAPNSIRFIYNYLFSSLRPWVRVQVTSKRFFCLGVRNFLLIVRFDSFTWKRELFTSFQTNFAKFKLNCWRNGRKNWWRKQNISVFILWPSTSSN